MRFLIIVICSLILSCSNNEPKETKAATLGKAEIWCDENLKSIIAQQEEVFELSYKYADLQINYAPENEVKDKLLIGNANVIISSIGLDSATIKKLNGQNIFPRQFPFGKSAIAFVTRKDVELNLSYEQLTEMLSGNNNEYVFSIEGKKSGIANDLLKHLNSNELGNNIYNLIRQMLLL